MRVRGLLGRSDRSSAVAFDFKRVLRADPGAVSLLVDLLDVLLDAGCRVVLSDAEHAPGIADAVENMVVERAGLEIAENCDRAIEWCEDRLLDAVGLSTPGDPVPLEENEFFTGLADAQIAHLVSQCVPRTASAGQEIVPVGADARSLIMFVSGCASVVLSLPDGEHARLDTNPQGSTYGEVLLVDETVQAAAVVADTDVEYYELPLAAVLELCQSEPHAMSTIMRNVAVDLALAFRTSTAEIRALHAGTILTTPQAVVTH